METTRERSRVVVAALVVMLAMALLPTIMTIVNLFALRDPPRTPASAAVSVLIPARNEEAGIAACVESVLTSSNTDLDVIVLDDHSTDATAAIVREIAKRDSRLSLHEAPPLPPGWSGKQHACHVLSGLATHPVLVFVDADVRLTSDATSRLAAALAQADLVSCVPRQIMGGVAELLLIPMINAILLGYLPIPLMRSDGRPSLGAGCGQLIAMRADAYERAGGHAAIRQSLHDGLLLPRLFRRAGLRTDLVAGSRLAACRMDVGWPATRAGALENATAGMATPATLPVWTVLLLGGHVMPWFALAASLTDGNGPMVGLSATACAAPLMVRLLQSLRFREPLRSVPLHPAGVLLLVVLQWYALMRQAAGRPSTWRGRTYPAQS